MSRTQAPDVLIASIAGMRKAVIRMQQQPTAEAVKLEALMLCAAAVGPLTANERFIR